MTKVMSDGGKGSVRRNEDTQKVLDGMARIFGESRLDKKLREEAAARKSEDTVSTLNEKEAKECMRDIEEAEYDDDDELCDWCNGTGEGQYDGSSCRKCHGTGMMPFDEVDDDYI